MPYFFDMADTPRYWPSPDAVAEKKTQQKYHTVMRKIFETVAPRIQRLIDTDPRWSTLYEEVMLEFVTPRVLRISPLLHPYALEEAIDTIVLDALEYLESKKRIALISNSIRSSAERVSCFSAERFSLQFLFPELGDSVSFSELGISPVEGGGFTLSSSGEANFNVRIFHLVNGPIAGFQLLKSLGYSSLYELLTDRLGDDSKIMYADTSSISLNKRLKNDTDMEVSDIVTAAKMSVNLQAMEDVLHLHMNDDGKWEVNVSARDFAKPWFSINGGALKGGKKLLIRMGLSDGTINYNAIKTFFELVFGESQIQVCEGSRGGTDLVKKMGSRRVLQNLASEENIRNFDQNGVTFEGDVCHIRSEIQQFRSYAYFTVDGAKYTGGYFMSKLGIPLTQAGIVEFVQRIFPHKRIILERQKNGALVKGALMDVYQREMCLNPNKDILASLCPKDELGRLIVNLSLHQFEGIFFKIEDRYVGIGRVLDELDELDTKEGVHALYQFVFSEENVVCQSDSRVARGSSGRYVALQS